MSGIQLTKIVVSAAILGIVLILWARSARRHAIEAALKSEQQRKDYMNAVAASEAL